MAKVSTSVKVSDVKQAEIKTKGILRVQEDNVIVVDTEDFGEMNVLALIDELNLRDVEVELKIVAKQEIIDDIDPLTI
jgi:hypothetical protein